MRTTRVIMKQHDVTTCTCDFCDISTDHNVQRYGTATIMQCEICDKDACRKHREFFTEDEYNDYPEGIYACSDCQPLVKQWWDHWREYAGRYDDIVLLTLEGAETGKPPVDPHE